MPHTPHGAQPECTHLRGPGTTLCLHCRQESRLAASIKRKRLMLRGTAGAIVVATFVTVSAFGATAFRGRNAAHRADSSAEPGTASTQPTPLLAGQPAAGQSAATQPPAAKVAVDPVSPRAVAGPSVVPIIPGGESMLADGVAASRSDGVVTVSFDKPMVRTRIPEKFERFLRTTLPAIYGARIDSSLTKIPIGGIARQGDLISVLPTSGVRIPIDAAWELRVFPETRPGVEGPLVVRYRATVCGAGQSECASR